MGSIIKVYATSAIRNKRGTKGSLQNYVMISVKLMKIWLGLVKLITATSRSLPPCTIRKEAAEIFSKIHFIYEHILNDFAMQIEMKEIERKKRMTQKMFFINHRIPG
jgi:hypothetical protein